MVLETLLPLEEVEKLDECDATGGRKDCEDVCETGEFSGFDDAPPPETDTW